MTYKNDPSLEELIADSMKKKKSARVVKVVKATPKEQHNDTFEVNIDYSKSEPEFYGEEPYSDNSGLAEGYNSGNTYGFDPEFMRSLKENFGSNLDDGDSSRRKKQKKTAPSQPENRKSEFRQDTVKSSEKSKSSAKKSVSAPVKRISHSESSRPAEKKADKFKNNAKNTVKQKKKETPDMEYYDEAVPEKKRHVVRNIFIVFLILLLLLGVLIYMYISKYAGLFNYVPTGERLDIENVFSDKSVTNILLIGSDARTPTSYGLSDSMILLSLNNETDEVVMSSFMRDMYVQIPGQEQETWHKLNWAHSRGGPELLMDTLEFNFGIEIDYYASVDFESFAQIVEAVGGLDITITDAEANAMKSPMAEQNDIFGNAWGTDYLYEAGSYHMNGNQALAYSRIRKGVGDDFSRTDRQREVIGLIAEKAKAMSVSQLDDLAEKILPKITTNMEKKLLMKLISKAPSLLKYQRVSQRIPYGDNYESWSYGSSASDGSIINPDFDLNKKLLMETIYHKS